MNVPINPLKTALSPYCPSLLRNPGILWHNCFARLGGKLSGFCVVKGSTK